MSLPKTIDKDFLFLLELKGASLIELFKDLRTFIIEIYPDANELLYHTHALTSVFSISDKLGDAFCMIPIYSNHMNLGFNKGTLLNDPHQLLKGTGNLIRHIPVSKPADYRNKKVKDLINTGIQQALSDMAKPIKVTGRIISKIKSK